MIDTCRCMLQFLYLVVLCSILSYLPGKVVSVVLSGKAASIADMCIMPNEFKARLSDCGQYCPISLANSELVDCSSYNRLTFAAEFQGNLRLL